MIRTELVSNSALYMAAGWQGLGSDIKLYRPADDSTRAGIHSCESQDIPSPLEFSTVGALGDRLRVACAHHGKRTSAAATAFLLCA